MQETQFGTRLVQEDKRWLLGDAEMGNVLAPFSADLAAPVSLESVPQSSPLLLPQPQPQPQLQLQPQPQPQPLPELTSALITVSVDINALAQEQIRLRETLETLTSTLFISANSLATKTAEVRAGVAESKQDEPASATPSWGEKSVELATDAVKFVGKEVFTGLWDKAKDRLSGKAIDAVAARYPKGAKWLKDDNGKGAEKGKDCCCTGAVPAQIRGPLDSAAAQLPESVGETARKEEKARPKDNPRRPRGKRNKARQIKSREVKIPEVRRRTDLKSQPTVTPAPAAPPVNIMGQPQLAFDSKRVSETTRSISGNSLTSYAAASADRVAAQGGPKGLAPGLSGTLAKLESSAVRRLGPLKYVDTAVDVVQGVRNGDVKAVGAGLGIAGGAWAGASAGAALGTLVFPGIGTAVGGAIGGLLGSEAGSWLGDKLFGSGDRLPAPNALSKELNSARTDNVQVTLSPSIQITGVNPADAQQVVNQVIQALQFQCVPMVTDSLGIRRNAALADPSGGD